jgi:hypothetical protein
VGNYPRFSYPWGSWKTSVLHGDSPHLTTGENTLKRAVDIECLCIVGLLVSEQHKLPVAHFVRGRPLCPIGKMTMENQVICILPLEAVGFHPQSTWHLHSSFMKYSSHSLEPTAAIKKTAVVHTSLQILSYIISEARDFCTQLSMGTVMLNSDTP